MKKAKSIPLAALCLLLAAPALAEEPWSVSPRHPAWNGPPPAAAERPWPGPLAYPLRWGIRLFQLGVSPADGEVCAFSPTCSAYGAEAIAAYGPLLGIPLACERILRDHHHPDLYRLELRGDRLILLDPLEDNLWWRHR